MACNDRDSHMDCVQKRDSPATATLEATVESAENDLNTSLLRAQRVLESCDDIHIRDFTEQFKGSWRQYEAANRALTSRQRQQGCESKANTLMKRRLQLHIEHANATISALNNRLEALGQDACSSIP